MTTDPSTTRKTEIRARLDAATPGPWSRFGRETGNEDGDSWFLGHDIEGPPEAQRGQFERVADADLIAHAPSDLAWALERIEALTAQRDAAQDDRDEKARERDQARDELAALPDLDTIRRIEKERGSWGMQLSEARRERDAFAAKVAAARKLHGRRIRFSPTTPEHPGHCENCGENWPCATTRALGLGQDGGENHG